MSYLKLFASIVIIMATVTVFVLWKKYRNAVGGQIPHCGDNDIHIVDGEKYLASKTVTLKGIEYLELRHTDFKKPSVLYAEVVDGTFKLVEDRDISYALSVKYAMCVLSLHSGVFFLDGGTLNLHEDEFVIENGKLVILNAEKRAIFDRHISERAR